MGDNDSASLYILSSPSTSFQGAISKPNKTLAQDVSAISLELELYYAPICDILAELYEYYQEIFTKLNS